MKASNYLAKLPQEATIKSIQAFRDYDLITLDIPAPRQRLCPHCGSTDCVIKDSGVWQTVRHIPSNHRGTAVTFHKRRLYCKECHSTFYENPYWIHPSLHMTQALYDSILLDLTGPISGRSSFYKSILLISLFKERIILQMSCLLYFCKTFHVRSFSSEINNISCICL